MQQQNKTILVQSRLTPSYDTWTGNKMGLFYNSPKPKHRP